MENKMREIKFRAWDRRYNKMHYQSTFAYFNDFFLSFEGEIKHAYGTKDAWSIDDIEQVDGKPLVVLMQYTGLKDKNGKEIYEGDIVNFLPFHLREKKIRTTGVVEYKDDGFFVKFTAIGYGRIQADHNIEVIGNIYENPELLKG